MTDMAMPDEIGGLLVDALPVALAGLHEIAYGDDRRAAVKAVELHLSALRALRVWKESLAAGSGRGPTPH